MARKQPIILKLNLGSNGVYSFKTLEEIEKWVQAEQSFGVGLMRYQLSMFLLIIFGKIIIQLLTISSTVLIKLAT